MRWGEQSVDERGRHATNGQCAEAESRREGAAVVRGGGGGDEVGAEGVMLERMEELEHVRRRVRSDDGNSCSLAH